MNTFKGTEFRQTNEMDTVKKSNQNFTKRKK